MTEAPKGWKDCLKIHETRGGQFYLQWCVWDEILDGEDDLGAVVGQPYDSQGPVDHEMRVVHETVKPLAYRFDAEHAMFLWDTASSARKALAEANRALKEYRNGKH